MIARTLVLASLVLAPASASARTGPPPLALTASPSHLTLVGSAAATIRITNRGSSPLLVDAAPAGFALSPRGRPRLLLTGPAARRAASWLAMRPSRLVLRPGGGAALALAASPGRGAAAGDYPAVVLLTARASRGGRVPVRLRIGITVVVRVPGSARHRLVVESVHVRRGARGCAVRLVVRNDGNVVERLARGIVTVSFVTRGHVRARIQSTPRELLPRARAVLELPVRHLLRGRITAVVGIAPGVGGALRPRTFHLRL